MAPRPAGAAGFYVGDVGARGLARGGAFVAAPDSVLALHYNPAGLSFLRGVHLESSLAIVDNRESFTRSCPCANPTKMDAAMTDASLTSGFGGRVASSSVLQAIPFLGASYGFDFLDTTVGIAIYGPHASKTDFGGASSPPNDPRFITDATAHPGRYSILYSEGWEANIALGAAMRPIGPLRIGAALVLYQVGQRSIRHSWLALGSAEDPRYDSPVQVRFLSGFKPTWTAGASVEVLPGLSIGASYRPPRHVHTSGTLDAQLPPALFDAAGQPMGGAQIVGNQAQIDFSLPAIGRVGVEYAREHLFRVEVAGVYEGWSSVDRLFVHPTNVGVQLSSGSTPTPIPDITIPRYWANTISLRVGGEAYLSGDDLIVRAGYFYEPSAILPQYLDVSQIDGPKHGISAGLGVRAFGLNLDVAASYIMISETNVHDSKLLQVPPLGAANDPNLTTVGNGRYSSTYLIIMGGGSLAFDL